MPRCKRDYDALRKIDAEYGCNVDIDGLVSDFEDAVEAVNRHIDELNYRDVSGEFDELMVAEPTDDSAEESSVEYPESEETA